MVHRGSNPGVDEIQGRFDSASLRECLGRIAQPATSSATLLSEEGFEDSTSSHHTNPPQDPMMASLFLCMSVRRLSIGVHCQGHWPRSTRILLRFHPAHCLVPHSTLPSEDRGVTLRSRFSVEGSDAGYPDAVDGDCSRLCGGL